MASGGSKIREATKCLSSFEWYRLKSFWYEFALSQYSRVPLRYRPSKLGCVLWKVPKLYILSVPALPSLIQMALWPNDDHSFSPGERVIKKTLRSLVSLSDASLQRSESALAIGMKWSANRNSQENTRLSNCSKRFWVTREDLGLRCWATLAEFGSLLCLADEPVIVQERWQHLTIPRCKRLHCYHYPFCRCVVERHQWRHHWSLKSTGCRRKKGFLGVSSSSCLAGPFIVELGFLDYSYRITNQYDTIMVMTPIVQSSCCRKKFTTYPRKQTVCFSH